MSIRSIITTLRMRGLTEETIGTRNPANGNALVAIARHLSDNPDHDLQTALAAGRVNTMQQGAALLDRFFKIPNAWVFLIQILQGKY